VSASKFTPEDRRALRYSIERRVLPALAGPKRLVPLQSLATKNVSRAALLGAAKRGRLRTIKMADELYSTREWVLRYCPSRQQGRRLASTEPVAEPRPASEPPSSDSARSNPRWRTDWRTVHSRRY
jgi:hypothetical protein